MRRLLLNSVLLLAGCAGATSGGSDVPGAAGSATAALGADLFPFEARQADFVMARGARGTLRVEPGAAADSAVLWFEETGAVPRRMDVRREGDGIVFSGGPDSTAELLRVGAMPGASWTSGEALVQFDGWERVTLGGGTYDAARVRVTSGPTTLPVVQTWWFAPGTGLVRLRSDRGGIFTDEMSLAGAR